MQQDRPLRSISPPRCRQPTPPHDERADLCAPDRGRAVSRSEVMMSFRRWLARWRGDVLALLSLDDRRLADIGLRRAEVAAVANGQLPLGQLTGRRSVSATD